MLKEVDLTREKLTVFQKIKLIIGRTTILHNILPFMDNCDIKWSSKQCKFTYSRTNQPFQQNECQKTEII